MRVCVVCECVWCVCVVCVCVFVRVCERQRQSNREGEREGKAFFAHKIFQGHCVTRLVVISFKIALLPEGFFLGTF